MRFSQNRRNPTRALEHQLPQTRELLDCPSVCSDERSKKISALLSKCQNCRQGAERRKKSKATPASWLRDGLWQGGGTPPRPKASRAPVRFFISAVHSDVSPRSEDWAAFSVKEVLTHVLKTGNHVCRADVCHKGRVGQFMFCRMQFRHRVRSTSKDGEAMARRAHGFQLQPQWNGEGIPLVHGGPPWAGSPALEVSHPFPYQLVPVHDAGLEM